MSDTKRDILVRLEKASDLERDDEVDEIQDACRDAQSEIRFLRHAVNKYADHWRGNDPARGGEWWECNTYGCSTDPDPCNCGFDAVEATMERIPIQ